MAEPVLEEPHVSGPAPAADARVLQARLQMAVETLRATVLFNPMSALVGGAIVSLPHSPFGSVALWRPAVALTAQIMSALVALAIFRRHRKVDLADLRHVERLLVLSQVLFSGVWGAVSYLYWVPGNDANHAYVVMVLSVVAFSAVFARSVHKPIFVTAVLVQCGLYLSRLVSDPSPSAHILAAMTPFFMLYLFIMGTASHRRMSAMIAARFAKEDLAEALTRTRDEAVQKRYEAEMANASKTAFLANMSHELRTPLNAILGFSDIIAHQSMGKGQADRYSDYAKDIHGSGVHLLSLINDLLDVAKIEAGKMQIDPRAMDPRTPIENVCRLIGPRAAARGQTLTADVPEDVPLVMADERAFKQVLLNLLSNAVKFTPEGGHITLTCRAPEGGGLHICVSDDGPGIAQDKLEHVFDAFSQIDNRFDREAGGTGLGLALVRGLVELHGGKAWLESTLGAGVRANIYFPSTLAAEGLKIPA